MGQPVSRLGDNSLCPADAHGCSACPHVVVGPAVTGSATFIVDGRPVLRVGDMGEHSACCSVNRWVAVEGSASVFVDGMPVVRMGDETQHCGGIGAMIEGSSSVFVGGGSTRVDGVALAFLASVAVADAGGPHSAAEAADYILKQMLQNAPGEIIEFIRDGLSYDGTWDVGPLEILKPPLWSLPRAAGFRAAAYEAFIRQVKAGGPWDYKLWMKPRFGERTYDQPSGRWFDNDIWGNIHYGYVGRAAGFSRTVLGAGGHGAQLLSSRSLDPKKDRTAIKIGMDLWDRHGETVTREQLLDEVRRRADDLQE